MSSQVFRLFRTVFKTLSDGLSCLKILLYILWHILLYLPILLETSVVSTSVFLWVWWKGLSHSYFFLSFFFCWGGGRGGINNPKTCLLEADFFNTFWHTSCGHHKHNKWQKAAGEPGILNRELQGAVRTKKKWQRSSPTWLSTLYYHTRQTLYLSYPSNKGSFMAREQFTFKILHGKKFQLWRNFYAKYNVIADFNHNKKPMGLALCLIRWKTMTT